MQQHSDSAARQSRGVGSLIVLAHAFGCLLFVGFVLNTVPLGFTLDELPYLLSVIVTVLSIWCVWSWWAMTRSWFNPYTIFFLSAALFNAGHAILEVFQLNPDGLLGELFSLETTVATLILVTLGLAFFHLGALVSALIANARGSAPERPGTSTRTTDRVIGAVGWSLLAISLPLSVLTAVGSLSVVMSGGYIALYQQNAAIGIDAAPKLVADFLIPAAILILAASRQRGVGVWVALGVIGANAAVQLFLGYRAFAIWPLLAGVWAYHRLVRPLPRFLLLGTAAFLMFVVFPLVPVTRNISGSDRDSAAVLWESYRSIDNPMISTISEIGGTMQTVAYTIDLVPAVRPFDGGVGYLYALTTVVPNVFGQGVHPATGHASHEWLAWAVDPAIASEGGGLGYSFIAEAFLNFGWLGAPVAMGVIGFGLATLFLWADRTGDRLNIALAAILLAFLSHFARGESTDIIRPFVWYGLGPYIVIATLSALATERRTVPRLRSRDGTALVAATAASGYRE
jgi:oligosaccharide repeat unit polymerase